MVRMLTFAMLAAGMLAGAAHATETETEASSTPVLAIEYDGDYSPEHYLYCAARHPSYDPGSNSYRSHSRGRRSCYSSYI